MVHGGANLFCRSQYSRIRAVRSSQAMSTLRPSGLKSAWRTAREFGHNCTSCGTLLQDGADPQSVQPRALGSVIQAQGLREIDQRAEPVAVVEHVLANSNVLLDEAVMAFLKRFFSGGN